MRHWVTYCYRAAVDIHLCRVPAEALVYTNRLRRERLIRLNEVKIRVRPARLL